MRVYFSERTAVIRLIGAVPWNIMTSWPFNVPAI